jgi:hypothetical protein
VAGNSRRGVLRFLAGVGVGAGIVEVYERLYNMPLLEERFRAEVSYWINEYNTARERINQLEHEYNSAKETITNLTNEYNLVREKINQLQEQHNSTLETISSMDRLEKESNQAILHYRERMDEAIKALRNTLEKYRVILGDERISFESTTLKVLEDLKLSQDKLLKLLPYFPLIRDLSWRPSRVVNDKIYDLEVSLEVISPLNTLAEVEVSLIPVEYEYFITNYGMRREDYPKAFPPEETKTVKLKPAGLERGTLNVDFKDIIGGREYLIRAIAKDVATSVNSEERKTHYIRQYENIAPLDGILVGAFYYPWYGPSRNHWREGYTGVPLLGEYFSGDQVVISKHIDWMTGHGIDFILPSWWGPYYEGYNGQPDANFKEFLKNPLAQHIKFAINYESNGRLKVCGTSPFENIFFGNSNRQRFLSDFDYLMDTYFNEPNFLTVDGKKAVFLYVTRIYQGDFNDTILELRSRSERKGHKLYIIGDEVFWHTPDSQIQYLDCDTNTIKTGPVEVEKIKTFDAITSYAMPDPTKQGSDLEQAIDSKFKEWYNASRQIGVDFIPSVFPGAFDPNRKITIAEKSTKRFLEQLTIAKKYLSRPRILLITSFNEWHENTYVEPNVTDRFIFLEKLKEFL